MNPVVLRPHASESNNPMGSGTTFRRVGFWACATLAVANMVGTGVFTSLGFQVAVLPSPWVILLVWGVGGVVALCGALSYAELASMFPRSGGEYTFISRIYGLRLGFAAAFVAVSVGFAAPIALVAMAIGEYLSGALPGVPARSVSFAALLALAVVHSVAVRASGVFQVLVTGLKITMITTFLVLGYRAGNVSGVSFMPSEGDTGLVFSSSFAVALMFVLYSYSGWNASSYILGEVRDPQRIVPRAMLAATLFVAGLYLLLNLLFLRSAPATAFDGQIEVAEIAARSLFGSEGGRLMAGLISLGLAASLSAMTWAGPRVAQAVGRDFPALGWLALTSASGVPRRALVLQTLLALVYLSTSSYEAVLVYTQFALMLCGFLTVTGLILMRWREPALDRPFRCTGYPLTPLVFLLVSAFALIHTAIEKPGEALAGTLTLAAGYGLYFLARTKRTEARI